MSDSSGMMFLASLILLVPLVACSRPPVQTCTGYLLSHPEHTSPRAGVQLHRRHTRDPHVLAWVELDLAHCPPNHDYRQDNITLEYVDGSDVTRTMRTLPAAFEYDHTRTKIKFAPNPHIYTDDVYVTTTNLLKCATLHITGCAQSGYPCWRTTCQNGGTCLGDNVTPQCVCPKGFFGDKCEHRVSEAKTDNFSFIGEINDTLYSQNGKFEEHGEIRLEKSSLHVSGEGGYCQMTQTNGSTSKRSRMYSSHHSSMLSGSGMGGYTHHGTFQCGSTHHHSHHVHFYNTHHNCNHNYQGASLTYHDHHLYYHVNNGQHMHSMSAYWRPQPHMTHHITSSYSPHYGLSLHVNGRPLGCVAGHHPAPSYACTHSATPLCMGSCGYHYNQHTSSHHHSGTSGTSTGGTGGIGGIGGIGGGTSHQQPHANYYMSSTHFTSMCLSMLVHNHLLSSLGHMPQLTFQTAPTQRVPPPPPMPQTTTIRAPTTTTAMNIPTTMRVPTKAPTTTTMAPTTTTTTMAPTTTTTMAPTTTTTTTMAPTTTTTTTMAPTTAYVYTATKSHATTVKRVPPTTTIGPLQIITNAPQAATVLVPEQTTMAPLQIITNAPKATTTTMVPTTTTMAPTTTTMAPPTTTTAVNASSQTGPLCWSCTKKSKDGTCTSMAACQSNEVCAVFHDPSGYTHKCLPKTTCTLAKALTHSTCWICCDVSLCNQRCEPAATCQDSANCGMLKSTGYDVCSDATFASSDCKKTCGLC